MLRAVAVAAALVSLFAATGCPALGSVYRDRDDVVVAGDIAYIDDGAAAHKLDLYSPRSANAAAPVIAFFHGGYWAGQDKQYYEFASGLYGNVGVAFARHGYRVANCNYRYFPEVKIDGMLEDIDAAVAFLRARFSGSPLIVMGHSAGAHLSTAAALLPTGPHTDVDAIVGLSGLYNIPRGIELDGGENDDILLPLFGDTEEEQATASTAPHIPGSPVPTMLVTGTDDLPGIILDWKELKELKGDDSDFAFAEVEGDHAGIVLQIASEDDGVTPAVLDFLRAHSIEP